MTRRIGNFLSRLALCARTDTRLFARAIAWRMALPVLKYAVPLRTLARWMAAQPTSACSAEAREARLASVRRLLTQGGRLVISGNCLERSLVLYRFLGEVGASPTLVMGLNRDDAKVGGHAWVELDGEPLAQETVGQFVPVLTFGPGTKSRRRPAPAGPLNLAAAQPGSVAAADREYVPDYVPVSARSPNGA